MSRQIATKIAEWRASPIQFVREVFNAEPDLWQLRVLEAAGDPETQRLALKACKGPGKSCVMSWIGWNFMLTRPHPKGVATSVTGDNLKDGLWTELAKWRQKSPLLMNLFTWTAERIFHNEYRETWWMAARSWPKGADANQQADTLAGIHADYVIFLIDEAGSIPHAVMAAADAALANHDLSAGREAKMMIAGNPTSVDSPLYDACTKDRKFWWVYEITGDPDSPERAPRISKDWANKQIETYGKDHPWVLVNVFGKFPPGSADTLIALQDAMDAAERTFHSKDYDFYPKILGVDVARYGDDRTIITPRQGPVVFKQKEYRNLSTMETANLVAYFYNEWQPARVFIDSVGVGAGVYDRLQELGLANIVAVESASKSPDEKFFNLRAHMWWTMAKEIKNTAIPKDGELIHELSKVKYKYAPNGKLLVESKDDMKKRGMNSPDKADSLALTYAYPVPIEDTGFVDALKEAMRQGPLVSDAGWDYNPYRGD